MSVNYSEISKLENYIEALRVAKGLIEDAENIVQPEPIDEVALKTSVRNRVVAGSGDKKDFFGSISTEPIVTKSDLTGMGLTMGVAEAIIAERDRIRSKALALTK